MNSSDFKVDFFCVGVAKAGTTTLHDLLSLQDRISLPTRKETNYFSFGMSGTPTFTGPLDHSSVNVPTITSMDDYIDDFDDKPGALIGEICPSYALDGAAANIHAHNPDAKIIILLREPVARAYSNYQHLVRDGREPGSFEEALAAESDRLAQGWEWFWGLKQNSTYHEFVSTYLDSFGADNVKIILFEDFVQDQEKYTREVMQFIGLDPATAKHEVFDSNKSGVVAGKWKFLHRLLLSEGALNSALRVILPTSVRKRLGALFKSLSTVRGGVASETRAQLSQEFSPDLIKLNALLDGRADGWIAEHHVS